MTHVETFLSSTLRRDCGAVGEPSSFTSSTRRVCNVLFDLFAALLAGRLVHNEKNNDAGAAGSRLPRFHFCCLLILAPSTFHRRPCRPKAAALGAAGMPRWARHYRPQVIPWHRTQEWAKSGRRQLNRNKIRPPRPQRRPHLRRAEKSRRRGRGLPRRTPALWRLSSLLAANRKKVVVVAIQRLQTRRMTTTGMRSPSPCQIGRLSSAFNASSTSKRSGRVR